MVILREIKSYIIIGLWAIIFSFFIHSFWIEPYRIPSGSMYPTLEIGDYIFVSKYSYGWRKYSANTNYIHISLPKFMQLFQKNPERGDVAIFYKDNEEKKTYIKRVIGLPGDTVYLRDGLLYINNKPVENRFNGTKEILDDYHRTIVVDEYTETLPNGVTYKIWKKHDIDPSQFPSTTEEYVVPNGHYFCLGDNRDNSGDSRFLDDLGYVSDDELLGKADVIALNYLAFVNKFRYIDGYQNELRFFKPIE